MRAHSYHLKRANDSRNIYLNRMRQRSVIRYPLPIRLAPLVITAQHNNTNDRTTPIMSTLMKWRSGLWLPPRAPPTQIRNDRNLNCQYPSLSNACHSLLCRPSIQITWGVPPSLGDPASLSFALSLSFHQLTITILWHQLNEQNNSSLRINLIMPLHSFTLSSWSMKFITERAET